MPEIAATPVRPYAPPTPCPVLTSEITVPPVCPYARGMRFTAVLLCACYAKPGTERAYGATRAQSPQRPRHTLPP
eukprot:3716541-Rhodomonas_salina.3